ncbi:MAG: GDP-mannose 4,6-dehydratase [Alphaproteobacteria bacterium]|nr:GDP-mannose 4,6-dehydratase [Alphaproteobacteria bacterium]
MRVLVTGASGFAGLHLLHHLRARGDTPIPWVHQPGGPHRAVDITDAEAVARALHADAPEALIHLAALTHLGDAERDPARAFAVNAQGTQSVFTALPEHLPAVYVSTSHVYGPPLTLPMSEDHPLAPRGVYAQSKARAEQLAREAHPRIVIARAFHHTGPGQSTRYAFPDWARQLAERQATRSRAPLCVGDVDVRRDYCDVRDVVAGYRLLLDAPPGETVNLCSGEAPPMRRWLEEMMVDWPVPLAQDPSRLRPAEVREMRGDPSRAEALGWTRRHPLAQTLEEMVREAQSQPTSP